MSAKIVTRISVLLPCHNGARTLGAAIKSILRQSESDFELLLLNDGSTDASCSIAEGFSDERIRIMGDDICRGLSYRLNEGVKAARGQYIARMDADDISFPERFARQARFLDERPEVDLVGCRAIVFASDGHIIGLLPFVPDHEGICARPWANIPLPHPSWMGRRSWFQQYRYRMPEVKRAEDQEMLLRACISSRYACLEDVLLGYRQGPFQFKRTLIARRSLLGAQVEMFFERKQWLNIIKAISITSVKIGIDCFATIPGFQRAFFFRMEERVPSEVESVLQHIQNAYTLQERA